ncbi:hypothetical protein RND81_05G081700 [Saponaria officinalis]|uniref:Uncharacterized protein n=1 Tax=Saponaria officinalis TaxID=3572 RepID=A0AAW1KZ14_SAPOF
MKIISSCIMLAVEFCIIFMVVVVFCMVVFTPAPAPAPAQYPPERSTIAKQSLVAAVIQVILEKLTEGKKFWYIIAIVAAGMVVYFLYTRVYLPWKNSTNSTTV